MNRLSDAAGDCSAAAIRAGAAGMDGVGVGVFSGVGVNVGDGAAVAVGSGVGAASTSVIAYSLKPVSVVIAHDAPPSSVSQRWSRSVHAVPETRYSRTSPSSQAVFSPDGSAKRKSTPSG